MRNHVFEDIFGNQPKVGDFILRPAGDQFILQQVVGIKNTLACNKILYKMGSYDTKIHTFSYTWCLKKVYLKAGKQFLIFHPNPELAALFSRPITDKDELVINKYIKFI